jgi:hypothetical protein
LTADSTSSNSGPGRRVPGARPPAASLTSTCSLLRDLDRFPDLAAKMRMYHTGTQ